LIRENIYVRVHGHVRAFGGKRSVVAFRVTPVPDVNEVTTHILEVIYAHAFLTRAAAAAVTPMVRILQRLMHDNFFRLYFNSYGLYLPAFDA